MTLEWVANEDLLVNASNTLGPSDLKYTSDPGIDLVKVVPVKSTTCKATGKFICTTSITLVWTLATGGCPYTSVLYDFIAGGGSILATATKVLADGQPVLRVDDPGPCTGSWKLKVTPFTVEPCNCDCSISAAGQVKVKAQ